MNFIIRLVVNAVALLIVAYFLPGVHVSSFWSALLVALILGLVNGMSGAYGTPEWTSAYMYALMIVILIFRPQGLFGGTMGPAIE